MTGKILVVDDEERMCQSMQALLSQEGYDVAAVLDGRDAIKRAQREPFDIVITDLRMSPLDGIKVLEGIKKVAPRTLIIILTAYATLNSAIEAIGKGAYDYLMKPVEYPDLKKTVERGLEKLRWERTQKRLMVELQEKNSLLEQGLRELDAVYEASKSLISLLKLEDALERIVNLAADVLGAKLGSLMILDDEEGVLTIKAAKGLEPKIIEQTRQKVGGSISGWVAQKGEPLLVEDIESDPRFRRLNREKYETKSLLSVPLRIKEKTLGVLNMNNKLSGQPFNQSDLRLLSTFASQAALAIENATLFEESRKRIRELSVLYRIASNLPSAENKEAMAAMVFQALKEIMSIESYHWFQQGKGKRFHLVLTCREGKIIPPTPVEICIEESQILEDLSEGVQTLLVSNNLFPSGAKESFSVPLMVRGQMRDIFCLLANKKLSEREKRLASILVSQAASLYETQSAILSAGQLMIMGQLVSEITHDLKQPLTGIRGTLQMLRQRWDELPSKENYLENLDKDILRLSDLVGELLRFSNPQEYAHQLRNIREIIDKAIDLVKRELQAKGVEVRIDSPQNLPSLPLNENEILQAIINIILNSLQAMPSGGKLGIELKQVEGEGGVFFLVGISDTGLGIPAEDLDHVFDRYFTTKEGGTGLGLSIVKRIIAAHQGRVEVKSTVGKGTTFNIYLPML